MRIVAVDGSPTGAGKTRSVIEHVVNAVGTTHDVTIVELGAEGGWAIDEALETINGGEAFVFGTPIYRASLAAPLKALLDRLPRGMWGETEEPLRGRAVAIVATGASFHHFLALNDLRNILSAFFAAHVVPPGLYVPRDGFDAEKLTEDYADLAAKQGTALLELATLLAESNTLRLLNPQA